MGYEYKYIIGNPFFSGIHDMLKSMGFEVIYENNSLGKHPKIDYYGLNDYNIFEEAKNQLKEIGNKPFSLYLSTINTHFPDGIYDQEMTKYVDKTKYKTNMEFSVASLDYLIGDFISYLEKITC